MNTIAIGDVTVEEFFNTIGQERTFVCSRILRAYDQTSPVVLSKHAPADVEKWKRCPTAFARDDASLSLSCQPSSVA